MNAADSQQSADADRAPLTIMLIEDNADEREAMQQLLSTRAERVLCCDGGQSALLELRRGSAPDVIVLDLLMPEMNGWQFRVEQKKEPAWATIPLIVVSGDHSAQAEAIDADAYLSKPILDDSLVHTVDRVVRDLERKRALARASEQERLLSLGALLGGIAHEINNPLAFIFGSIDLLQRQLATAALNQHAGEPFSIATAMRAVDRAKQGAERIAKVVRSASMFASADLESLETIDIHQVLEASLQIASNEIRHGAHLVRSFGEVQRVYGNPAKLGQVLLNLLLHTVYAIRERGGRDHVIRVATFSDGPYVVVAVSDSATEFEPHAHATIVEPSLASHGSATRLHLGLAVSRELIIEMGGRLEVEFLKPRGVTFRVLLPSHTRSSFPPPPPSAPTRVHARKDSVLVIDDEPLMCELLAATLEDDFRVTAFTSPRAALSALLDGEYDAVLCDVMMPDLNGVDLYEQVVASRPELASRFIFITGGAFTERARLFLRRAAGPVLRKPCSRQELLDAIASVGCTTDPAA